MTEFLPLLAAMLTLAAVAWLALTIRAALAAAEQNAEARIQRLESTLVQALRLTETDLAAGFERQVERLAGTQVETAERLRSQVFEALRATGDAVADTRRTVEQGGALQREDLAARLAELTQATATRHEQLRGQLTEAMLKSVAEQARADRELLQEGLKAASLQMATSNEALMRVLSERLDAITGVVHQRLDEGFKKTNETFASVMARLATIDEAQKKIDGLTTNVVSLQELLGDKRSRGAFGEVQLEALVKNALPPDGYAFQVQLASGVRADCVLNLPEPTGRVAVDAKFPLENYHRMFDTDVGDVERKSAQTAFRADVKRHVEAIASKYIIPGETSDGAVMFVPAEAVFAEIHAYHPEVVQFALARRVWIVSPTTLMAVLNTARAVLKDVETRKQIHVIKDALGKLAKDFTRFDERMQKLATHIRQAHEDVQDVHTSSKKISGHFTRIEQVQLEDLPRALSEDDSQ
ncbi:DNA recombination protein RmuC [Niveibacterium microcysteis]|uniref:DNA recombination protein RmuC n=1 Tax=Niveibacterium microcysteis TaxID=2811415 RepID=A0ABX7MDC0_9RHOO|nr:DNA recombination protein RmuC [Niveibacterium microcysteis]QSI78883.1 DNA recombination protein RmuC [Niveibacterium microcysteis]